MEDKKSLVDSLVDIIVFLFVYFLGLFILFCIGIVSENNYTYESRVETVNITKKIPGKDVYFEIDDTNLSKTYDVTNYMYVNGNLIPYSSSHDKTITKKVLTYLDENNQYISKDITLFDELIFEESDENKIMFEYEDKINKKGKTVSVDNKKITIYYTENN